MRLLALALLLLAAPASAATILPEPGTLGLVALAVSTLRLRRGCISRPR